MIWQAMGKPWNGFSDKLLERFVIEGVEFLSNRTSIGDSPTDFDYDLKLNQQK